MKIQSKKSMLLLTALIGTLSIGSIAGYFTDGDTATNTFTVGKISLDLQESDWVPPVNIVPQQEFKKNPQIKNDGLNEEFVFVKVTVPYAHLVTANEDGTKNQASDTELFSYDVNSGWTELSSEMVKDTTNKTITHLYAYTGEYATTMEPLEVNATTPSVFDYVRFANIVEDQSIEATTLNVVVNAYGIQTTNLYDGKESLDGNNADGKVAPEEVWNIIETQNPSLQNMVEEDAFTDIKQ